VTTIYIEGRPYDADQSTNLLAACLSLGFDIPYFCWHPAMGSIGACRQCAVKKFKDEKDTEGRIVMSCMEPVVEGLRISIDDPEVRAFRAAVIEWMMVNHPHDCPVCDEGGECHLQDMTVMTGHNTRRCRFPKRTHLNQDLGPFIHHEMNRCIQCHRCVRFYRDTVGGTDLMAFSTRDRLFFGRAKSGKLESPFSGNLVEVCPTGVFTDKTFKRHYTRKWDLMTAPSVCVHCSLGCNTILGERTGTLRRVRNRYNGEVNGYFLCDRGRFGYEFVNSESRILRSREKLGGETDRPSAGRGFAEPVTKAAARGRAIGIGSPRASLESNAALRALVGKGNFYAGVSARDHDLTTLALDIMTRGAGRIASLRDAGLADAVLVLGEDPMETAPMLGLALLQSVRQKPLEGIRAARISSWDDTAVREFLEGEKGPLEIVSPRTTALAAWGRETLLAPDDIARLGFSIARILSGKEPSGRDDPAGAAEAARRIARALSGAKRPLVIAGTAGGSEMILRAAAEIIRALAADHPEAAECFIFPECNSVGLAMMQAGRLSEAMAKVREGSVESVIILENDLYRRAEKSVVEAFFAAARTVVALDHLDTATTAKADVVLAAATFAESDGTLVNNEGRAQRYFKVHRPPSEVKESWRWLGEIASAARGEAGPSVCFDDAVNAAASSVPALAGIRDAAPGADFRIRGQKIPRQPFRWSGRTANDAAVDVNEPKPPEDPDSALAFSMEGSAALPPPPLIPRFWSPGWNSVQAVNKYQIEAGGALAGGDPGKRLIRPSGDLASFEPGGGMSPETGPERGIRVVAAHHLFGSEELSARSSCIAGLVPEPYILLHPEDASALGAAPGDVIELRIGSETVSLPARVTPGIARGVAAVPSGLPGLPGLPVPGWAVVEAVRK
jgi:NADH-quinone oxidoreductase subunit G